MAIVKREFQLPTTGIWDNTHFKWYTYKTGARLMEENGFEIITKTVTGKLPGASALSTMFSDKFSTELYNQLEKISPGFLGYQLLYVAMVK